MRLYFKKFAHNPLIYIFIICFLGILAYANAFSCSFHFDDSFFITDNLAIKNLNAWQKIWAYYPCRFIPLLTYALNYHWDGLNVWGYHLFNLCIHIGCAIVLFLLTLTIYETKPLQESHLVLNKYLISFFTSVLFIVHPLHVESVTYICQRATCLGAFFYLSAVLFYIKSRVSPLKFKGFNFYYFLSLIATLLAMLSKENTITLPIIILLIEYILLKPTKTFPWATMTPFLLSILVIPLVMLLTHSGLFHDIRIIATHADGITPTHYLFSEFRVIMTYIRLITFPFHQNLDYAYPIFTNFFTTPVMGSFLILIMILSLTIYYCRQFPVLSFGILWFLITLIPESSLLPARDLIFEHRLYLPLTGFCLFIVSFLFYTFNKKILKVLLSAILVIFIFLTYQRNFIWTNDLTLWSDTSHKSPSKSRPYLNLGNAYYAAHDYTHSIINYSKAAFLNKDNPIVFNNRGRAYFMLHEPSKALADFNTAIMMNPRFTNAYVNRGVLFETLGNLTAARQDYEKAITLDPLGVDGYINLGIIFGKEGDLKHALELFNKAIALDPHNPKAYANRGLVYYAMDNLTQSLIDLNTALRTDPNLAESYNNRGLIFLKQQQYSAALNDFNKALNLIPNYPTAIKNKRIAEFKYHIQSLQ